MKPDILDAAAQSLRDAGDGLSVSPQEGATRVLREVRALRRRRRVARIALVQVCAVLMGFGAWAAGTGRLSRLVHEGTWQSRSQPQPTSPRMRRSVAPPTSTTIALTMEPPLAPPEPLVVQAPVATISERKSLPRATGPAPRVHSLVPRPPASPEQLYQRAHEAHFARKDWAAAVVLWDAYLGSGDLRFKVEAHYNRAIALARLDRKQEAAAALRPFADGEYGAYRRNEAIRLLQWIARPPN